MRAEVQGRAELGCKHLIRNVGWQSPYVRNVLGANLCESD